MQFLYEVNFHFNCTLGKLVYGTFFSLFLVFGGQIRFDDGAPEGVTAADAVDELGGKPELGTLRHDVRHTVH